VRVYSKNLSFPISSVFEMEGTKLARGAIGGINGMGNTFDEAQDHCRYLKLLSSNHHIEWTHNCSHSIPLDIAETLFFNFQGFSAPAKFLKENWEKFHKSHANDPDAKYLQFCHSQGALHVRNALSHVSKEIRDRVTVVAIAPATIIPKKLCYDSFNYVSKSDPIPALETTWLIGFEAPPPHTLAIISQEAFKELLILEPHPEARGWDHGFQSTTFREIIKKHLEKHITEYGTIK
jgi:hypothetical protein